MSLQIADFNIFELDSISSNLSKDFDDFWNYAIIKKELDNPLNSYICLKDDNTIIGFAGISCIEDIAELNYIVIKKTKRNKGYSKLLLNELKQIALSKNCTMLNLEVSSNNIYAIKLYKSFGFIQVGLRKGYYNGTDALLFTLPIN